MQIWIPHHPFSWPICFCFPWTLKHSSKYMWNCIHQRPGGDMSDPIQHWPYSHFMQGAGQILFQPTFLWFHDSVLLKLISTQKSMQIHIHKTQHQSLCYILVSDQSQQQGNMHSSVSQNCTLSLTTSKSLRADKLPA